MEGAWVPDSSFRKASLETCLIRKVYTGTGIMKVQPHEALGAYLEPGGMLMLSSWVRVPSGCLPVADTVVVMNTIWLVGLEMLIIFSFPQLPSPEAADYTRRAVS